MSNASDNDQCTDKGCPVTEHVGDHTAGIGWDGGQGDSATCGSK